MYIVRARYDIRDVRIVSYSLNVTNSGIGYCIPYHFIFDQLIYHTDNEPIYVMHFHLLHL